MLKHNRNAIAKTVEALGKEQPWSHNIELPYGIKTIDKEQISHGKNLVKWSRIEPYINEIDVKSKRVLDAGCNEGFFSLKLAQLGAREVVAFDADELRIKKAKFAAETLEASGIAYKVMDIFDGSIDKLGHFDFVLCMGFLHRVPHPYEALQQLAKISDTILIEWKSLKEGTFHLPIMKFCGGKSKDSNKYSGLYWVPSVRCVADILETLGFTHKLVIDNSAWHRTIVISSRFDSQIFGNGDVSNTNKFDLLRRVTRSYLRSVLETLRNDKMKWL